MFTSAFPSEHEPTRGVYNLRRAQALARCCEVRVVSPVSVQRRLMRPREWFGAPVFLYEGLTVTYPTTWAVPRILPRWYTRQMYQSIQAHMLDVRRQFRFDVILAAFAYPDVVVAARAAEHIGCPMVALVMGSDINVLAQRPVLKNEIRWALLRAHSVIAVSEALKIGVVALGIPADRVVVQHNGVDGEKFIVRDQAQARNQLGLNPDQRIVCFIGNLEAEKGPDVLLDAIAHMAPSVPGSLVVIFIGDGQLREHLSATAQRVGLGANVRFVGRRPHDEIPLWMSAADVLCLPSRREGCPNVILEALAAGCPVVASGVGGVPELLVDSTGLTVPPDDPAALALGLLAALGRKWNPIELRASVGSLTWDGFGRVLSERLLASLESVSV